MARSSHSAARTLRPWAGPVLLLAASLAGVWTWSAPASAEDESSESSAIVKVEEDWELVVQSPDWDTLAPQVTTTISPFASTAGTHAVIDFNLRTEPNVEPGGMQIQIWHGDESLDISREHAGTLLHHDDETVTWTTQMRIDNGRLKFKIKDGTSQTWGTFGSDSSLQVSKSTDVENLNNYSPATSVANSGVGFASNRVTSLKLLRVRAYTAAGVVTEDNTVRTVFQHE